MSMFAAPKLEAKGWVDRPDHPRHMVVWEHFDAKGIMHDFYATMDRPVPAGAR